MSRKASREPVEIAVIGDVEDWEKDVLQALLEVPAGSECVFYIDSSGGNIYGALGVLTLMIHRKLLGKAIVLGECSSATLWLMAGCRHRIVTPFSACLFHGMRWESEKRVTTREAVGWATHFQQIERDMDDLLVRLFGRAETQIREWLAAERYITGAELVQAGLAEMMDLG